MKRIQSILLMITMMLSSASTLIGSEYEVFDKLRQHAKTNKPYPGSPGEGKKFAFANIVNAPGFVASVEENVIKQAKLAGFSEDDIIVVNNQYNAVIGLKNADIVLAKKPDVFVEFQFDAKVNNIVARKFKRAGIPIIAVDVAVPGAPFMGVDNFGAAFLGGEAMAKAIKNKLGGWEKLGKVALLQFPTGGSATMMRSEGFVPALEEAFGNQVEDKIIRVDGGSGSTEDAKKSMDDLLAANPNVETWAVTAINHESIAGVIAAFQAAGRWDPKKIILIGLGAGALGQSQIRDDLIDAAVASFPETYGEYIVPAAIARMQGEPVPPYILIEHEVITKQNINHFYPL